MPDSTTKYEVKFFEAARSRAGKPSVLVATFPTREAAEAFAVGKRIYGKPACVREVVSC